MVSSAIWKKNMPSEFFKDDRNCTSPKDECNLKSLKTHECIFSKLHEKTYYYLLITYMKKLLKIACFDDTCVLNYAI